MTNLVIFKFKKANLKLKLIYEKKVQKYSKYSSRTFFICSPNKSLYKTTAQEFIFYFVINQAQTVAS